MPASASLRGCPCRAGRAKSRLRELGVLLRSAWRLRHQHDADVSCIQCQHTMASIPWTITAACLEDHYPPQPLGAHMHKCTAAAGAHCTHWPQSPHSMPLEQPHFCLLIPPTGRPAASCYTLYLQPAVQRTLRTGNHDSRLSSHVRGSTSSTSSSGRHPGIQATEAPGSGLQPQLPP